MYNNEDDKDKNILSHVLETRNSQSAAATQGSMRGVQIIKGT